MEQNIIETPDTTEISTRAEDLIASVGRAVIDSPETENKGGDLLKMLKTIKAKAEEDRKTITGPINAALKAINAKYKLVTVPVDGAIKDLNQKMVTYKMEVQRKIQEQERIEREKREAEALEKAAELEADGKDEAASELVEMAENASEKTQEAVKSQTVRSDHGATTTMTDKWSAQVVDLRALCQAIVDGKADVNCVMENQPHLNKLAKSMKDELKIPGVAAVNNPVLTSR